MLAQSLIRDQCCSCCKVWFGYCPVNFIHVALHCMFDFTIFTVSLGKWNVSSFYFNCLQRLMKLPANPFHCCFTWRRDVRCYRRISALKKKKLIRNDKQFTVIWMLLLLEHFPLHAFVYHRVSNALTVLSDSKRLLACFHLKQWKWRLQLCCQGAGFTDIWILWMIRLFTIREQTDQWGETVLEQHQLQSSIIWSGTINKVYDTSYANCVIMLIISSILSYNCWESTGIKTCQGFTH